jgi:hypothetical protein
MTVQLLGKYGYYSVLFCIIDPCRLEQFAFVQRAGLPHAFEIVPVKTLDTNRFSQSLQPEGRLKSDATLMNSKGASWMRLVVASPV